jgi:hypothetical protein
LVPELQISGIDSGRAEVLKPTTWIRLAGPNPITAGQTSELRVGLPDQGEVDVWLFDAAGRRVRHLLTAKGPGIIDLQWDGRLGEGEPMRSGVYVAAVVDNARQIAASTKIVVVR